MAVAKKCKHCGAFFDGKGHMGTANDSAAHKWWRNKKWLFASLLVPIAIAVALILKGGAEAQFKRGVHYMVTAGLGATQDSREPVKWFRKAAAQGHEGARYYLKLLKIPF